jgi:hypothetical protein
MKSFKDQNFIANCEKCVFGWKKRGGYNVVLAQFSLIQIYMA